mmetsp:Transcript_2298/g.3492  ORF Transcript_2298/g.3492 Transcript_2298/m.3492 type:complete len:223 (-) Transcript_2298:1449-2117(-)
MGTVLWKTIQDHIDAHNPKAPKRSATDWMNSAVHQMLKFSLRCWKARNRMVHGATKTEQRTIQLHKIREKITSIYENPPTIANHYRSIFEVPLVHRLKMPLQAAEHWVSMIAHQIKVTQHNLKVLLSQHKPMHAHFRTMRREARTQAKERHLPSTPRKAHSRAVQAAVKEMRTKLYAPKVTTKTPKRASNKRNHHPSSFLPKSVISIQSLQSPRPPLRQHPP